MKIKGVFVTSVLVSFLVGCLANPPAQITAETQATPPASTLWVQPSPATALDKSPTQIPVGFSIQNHCPEIAVGIDKIPALVGTLVFSGDNVLDNKSNFLSLEPGYNPALSFWNPRENTVASYNLPDEYFYYHYAESPNKEKLAITQGKTVDDISYDLFILNSQGEEYKRIAFPGDWTFFTWLGNEKLLFRQFRNQNLALRESLDLVSINLFDEGQAILPSDFPTIYTREMLVTWGAITIFSPTTSLVVYPKRENDVGRVISILWDLEETEEVTRIVNGEWPIWSPDGNQLLMVADVEPLLHEWHDEIYLIDSSGDISRVTFFGEHFDNVSIDLPAWSPSGRHVAFWLSTSLSLQTAKLAVLDTETLVVDLFCNEINPFPWRFSSHLNLGYGDMQINSAQPIWSPDSRYLLIEDSMSGYSLQYNHAYLFDLENYIITQLSTSARSVAWLK